MSNNVEKRIRRKVILTFVLDVIEDEMQGYVYKIKVKPQTNILKVGHKDMPISPGMTAQAEVKTERTQGTRLKQLSYSEVNNQKTCCLISLPGPLFVPICSYLFLFVLANDFPYFLKANTFLKKSDREKLIMMLRKLLLCCVLVLGLSSVAMAEEKIFTSNADLEKAVLEAVNNRQTEIELLCKYSDTQILSDPMDNALGKYGECKYGKNFILNGVDSVKYMGTIEGGTIHYKYQVKYNYTKLQEKNLQEQLKTWVDENLTPDMSDTVKAALITKYIADNVRYNESRSYDNAVGAFDKKLANSTGYAELASRMYTLAGLENCIITGITKGPNVHWDNRTEVTVNYLHTIRYPDDVVNIRDLQAWNLVRVDGAWYHTNICKYRMFPWKIEDGNEEELFNSDAIFSETDGWIKSQYPIAERTLWYGDGSDKRFLKGWFKTILFDFPIVRAQEEFDKIVYDALEQGKARVQAIVVSSPCPVGECSVFQSSYGKVGILSMTDLKNVAMNYKVFHAELIPNVPEVVYPMDRIPSKIVLKCGELVSKTAIINPKNSSGKAPELVVLSPNSIRETADGLTAIKAGVAYVSAVNGDEAKVVKIEISEPKLQIILNGNVLETAEPIVVNGRTLVPLRALFQAMGAYVEYEPKARTISAVRGNALINLTLGETTAVINHIECKMDTPPDIIDGKAYVPVRFVAESLGAKVSWDELRKKVVISDDINP